jgi:hypothetical protein
VAGLPEWFHKDRERQNTRSRKQERDYAKERQGKVQAGSGSSWRRPQDVQEADSLTQLKFTDKDSFTINVKEWKGIRADALRDGREGKIVIEFSKHGIRLAVSEA